MWTKKRLLTAAVLLVVLISYAIPGLPYGKLSWITNAQTYGGAGNPPEDLSDGSLPISKSVVGQFVKDCQIYWKPSLSHSIDLTIAAGKTYYVVGINKAGTFYRVALLPFIKVWVPVDCLAPHMDQFWHGTPLPTNTVQD